MPTVRAFPILTYFYESNEILYEKYSTLNLSKSADFKTISVSHGLIQFFCLKDLEVLERNML